MHCFSGLCVRRQAQIGAGSGAGWGRRLRAAAQYGRGGGELSIVRAAAGGGAGRGGRLRATAHDGAGGGWPLRRGALDAGVMETKLF